MSDTTIRISKEVQSALKREKRAGEGYGPAIQRALDDQKTLKYIFRLMSNREWVQTFAELQKVNFNDDEL